MGRGNPWLEAKALSVVRGNYPLFPPAELESGVKFFVLMLEKLHCKTMFSCEGHPFGFYILFKCDCPLTVRRLAALNNFTIEVDHRENTYRLSLVQNEVHYARRGEWTETMKNNILTLIARDWVKAFGRLRKLNANVPVVAAATDPGAAEGGQVRPPGPVPA